MTDAVARGLTVACTFTGVWDLKDGMLRTVWMSVFYVGRAEDGIANGTSHLKVTFKTDSFQNVLP